MTAYEKPSLAIREIEELLRNHFGTDVAEVTPMAGGNLSSVFSFVHEGKDYCVKFSDLAGAYETERYVSDLLSGHGIPFPKCYALKKTGRLAYLITERMAGRNLADCTEAEQTNQIPELIGILTSMAEVEVGCGRRKAADEHGSPTACRRWNAETKRRLCFAHSLRSSDDHVVQARYARTSAQQISPYSEQQSAFNTLVRFQLNELTFYLCQEHSHHHHGLSTTIHDLLP